MATAADEPAATPAADTFSLSSKMIRSASFLPMPGIDDEDRLVLLEDRELEVRGGPRPDDRERDLGPTPVTVSSRLKNPSSSDVRNPNSACWSSRTRW